MRTVLCTGAALFVSLLMLPASITKVEIDSAAYHYLQRVLISGGDFFYPEHTNERGGSCGSIMHLKPDGTVQSVKLVSSSGNSAFDQQVLKTLRGYRFKPGTKGPFRWYISFIQPAKIIVVFAPE